MWCPPNMEKNILENHKLRCDSNRSCRCIVGNRGLFRLGLQDRHKPTEPQTRAGSTGRPIWVQTESRGELQDYRSNSCWSELIRSHMGINIIISRKFCFWQHQTFQNTTLPQHFQNENTISEFSQLNKPVSFHNDTQAQYFQNETQP